MEYALWTRSAIYFGIAEALTNGATMSAAFKRIWSDPVGSAAIAALIVAPILWGFGYVFDWLVAKTTVSNWILVCLFVVCCISLVKTVARVRERTLKAVIFPPWKIYLADYFLGLVWRWSFFDDGTIYDLAAFCPYDDYQVVSLDVFPHRINSPIAFHCESCGRTLEEFNESYDELQRRIRRLAQQAIRTDAWRSRMAAFAARPPPDSTAAK